jgi:hypothetical protein
MGVLNEKRCKKVVPKGITFHNFVKKVVLQKDLIAFY